MAPFDIPVEKKLKSSLSAGKIVVRDFWNGRGVILVNFLAGRTTLTSNI
jgi:hypothetical protein